jgi:transcriptional regulator of acetoin/glycerol metabolism
MERAIALVCGDRIGPEDLPAELREADGEGIAAALPLAEIERRHILAVFAQNQGNHARTAAQLEIGTATLYRKLKSYGRLADAGVEAEGG